MEVLRPADSFDCSAPRRRWRLLRALPVCAILLGGCHTYSLSNEQRLCTAPEMPAALVSSGVPPGEGRLFFTRRSTESLPGTDAESHLLLARQMQAEGRDGCVDQYYQAARLAWDALELACIEEDPDAQEAAGHIYQESLGGLIEAGQQFRRLDPRGSLTIVDDRGRRVIPLAYYGFAWKAADFSQLLSSQEYQDSSLTHHYQTPGLGASLVAVRHACHEEPYYRPQQPFSVTAILRPVSSAERRLPSSLATDRHCPDAVLEFYNPCVFDAMPVGRRTLPLQRDLTAPFVHVAKASTRFYLEGFLDPGETDVQPKLLMMEPYQRGKIPVIFIHGLLSDPTTWLDAANELRAQRDLYQQFQFWYFRYPTGGSLLDSAAALREQLLVVRETFDPAGQDPALSRMVLVGHSMGGLVARLQVTYSSDILWRHAARQPLEAVRTTPKLRARMERDFFFDPSPLVQRVVFIGTPHRGSNMARRLVGRVASSLVRPFSVGAADYQQLMDQNREVFFDYLHDAPPTSIDLLEPSNPLLEALAAMPFGRGVRLHSIVGTGGTLPLGEPSDGVVPVASAELAGVCSERKLPATHRQLQHAPETLAELSRILREHAQNASPYAAGLLPLGPPRTETAGATPSRVAD